MNNTIKILTFNIQHLHTSTSKTTQFLLLIASKSPDIIGLTEFDSSDPTIHSIFQNAGYTPIISPTINTPRSQLFIKTSNLHKLTSSNTLQHCFPYPYNKYITDFTYTEENTEYHIISVYAPTYRSIPRPNHPSHVTNQLFHEHLKTAIHQSSLTNPIFMGDWNTPPLSTTDNILTSISNIDATTFIKGKHKWLPTNHHPTTPQRLDRFYVPSHLFSGYTCRYTVLPKQSYSSHCPVLLSFKKWVPRRGRVWHDETFDPILYLERKQPIDNIYFHQQSAIDTIFKPTTSWEDDALLSLDYYTETIYTRYKKWKRMYTTTNNQHLNTNTKLSRLQKAHSGNTLSSTYKELNLRFTKKLDQTTFSDETMENTFTLFNSIFDNPNPQHQQQQIEEIFQQEYSTLIHNTLNAEDIEHLQKPFTPEEIFNNLKALNQKGPSSPGPDGITYSTWYLGWEHAKKHLTNAANSILTQEIPSSSSLFNTLIKLIPKKDYDPNHPNPSHIRPISLTNCSFRLINYSMTRRSMPLFNKIIGKHQQAFLNGRDMNYHIQTAKLLSHQLQHRHEANNPSVLLLDITKAFDTLSHQFIPVVMKHYKFPSIFIQNIICQNQHGKVHLLNNRYIYKKKIKLRCGVRQGLPISPLIFNLCLEPLILKLQRDLTGITYNPLHLQPTNNYHIALTHNVKIQAFADDIITFNKDIDDLIQTQQTCNTYAIFSGLVMNQRKTVIYTHQKSIQPLKEAFRSDIKITSWEENPKYLGINLISINWEKKLEELYARTRRILFLDLPLHLIILGINTYIFSTIYFHDQHDPIPTKLVSNFIQQIQNLLTKATYPQLPKKCNLWYIPRSQGGFGLIDLPKQLIGRQAHFIMYALQNTTTISNHPHFPTLLRIQLQIYAAEHTQLQHIQETIMTEVNQAIADNQTTFTLSQTLQQALQCEAETYDNIQTWISLLHTTPKTGHLNIPHINTSSPQPKFQLNYSQTLRNHYRIANGLRIRAQEEEYLRNNIIPPPMGATFPPLTLELPSDQKLDIQLPLQHDTYPPLKHYMKAWFTILKPILSQTKITQCTPLQLHTLTHEPSKHPDYAIHHLLHPKPEFCKTNTNNVTSAGLKELHHLSKTFHDNQQYLTTTARTWIKDNPATPRMWKKFFKEMGPRLISNIQSLYYLNALNTGLLNTTFYQPCTLCNESSLPLSPLRHTINKCKIATHIYKFYTKQPQPPNLTLLICPQEPENYNTYSKFIGFLTYCVRYSYAKNQDQHPQLTWEQEELETIKLQYNNR